MFELLIDATLATLLIVTIVYCSILNRRIRVLQDGRGELARVLKHFDESTRRASDSIAVLQSTGKRVGEVIQARMERATQLSDDLNYLIDHAEKIADRLEAGINVSRSARKVQEEMSSPPPRPKPPSPANEASPPPAAPEDEMLVRAAVKAALEEDLAHVPPPYKPSEKPAAQPKVGTAGTLQAMIEKIANRTASDPALRGQRASKFPETRARSRVEQELLEIIRAEKG